MLRCNTPFLYRSVRVQASPLHALFPVPHFHRHPLRRVPDLLAHRLAAAYHRSGTLSGNCCSSDLAGLLWGDHRPGRGQPSSRSELGEAGGWEGSGTRACKEEKHSEPSSGHSGVPEKTEAEKAVKSEKKDKPEKDKKKRKDKGIEETSSGEEESPGKEVKGKRKKAEDLQSDKKKKVKVEEKEDTKETPRRVTAAEELQDRVDEFVSSNPGSFELGTLPVRGSVARTLEEGRRRREGGERRPAEPDHPPPRRHEDHRRGETGPRAQGERKKKKSKGATHRARGRRWRENRRQY